MCDFHSSSVEKTKPSLRTRSVSPLQGRVSPTKQTVNFTPDSKSLTRKGIASSYQVRVWTRRVSPLQGQVSPIKQTANFTPDSK